MYEVDHNIFIRMQCNAYILFGLMTAKNSFIFATTHLAFHIGRLAGWTCSAANFIHNCVVHSVASIHITIWKTPTLSRQGLGTAAPNRIRIFALQS